MTETAIENNPAEPDFSGDFFDQWIGGASASRRSVPIYGKPGLFAEYQQIQRQLEVERSAAAGGDEMAGSPIKALERRLQEIFDEWEASRTTWVVESSDDDAIKRAKKGLTEPVEPPAPERPADPERPAPLPPNASDVQRRVHTVASKAHEAAVAAHAAALLEWEADMAAYEAGPLDEYQKALEEYSDEVNLRLIAASLVEIRDSNNDVRQTSITVDQLRQMAKTLGKPQLLRLMAGITEATYEETVIPAPFWQASSEDAPTS